MRNTHLLFVAVLGVILAHDQCNAAFTNVTAEATVPDAPGTIPTGHTVYRVYANFSNPADVWLSVGNCNWVFTGNLYQNGFGGNGPPNPALIPFFPELASDTFVTIDDLTDPTDSLLFDPAFAFGPASVSGGWADSNPATPIAAGADLKVLIAQITLPFTAIGGGVGNVFWKANGQGNAIQSSFSFPPPPAPGALPLLLMGGLLAARRRRG